MSDLPPIIQKFGIDLTNYVTGIVQIQRSIRVLESEFRGSSAILGDWSKSASGLEMRLKSLTSLIELQKTKVEVTRKEYERIKSEKGENSRAAQDLQIKLNNETATLGKMQVELKDTEKKLEVMGKEEKSTKDKTDQLDKSEEKATKSTINLGNAMKSLTGHLKNAGSGIVTVIGHVAKLAAGLAIGLVAGATAAVVGLGALVSKAATLGDQFAGLSGVTGISTTRLQELDYIGKKLDVDLSTVSGSVSKLIRSLNSAKDGTGEQAKAFKSLGIQILDSNGKFRDSNEIWMETIDALGKVENETERDALAMTIFGKSAMELNPLITAGSDRLKELADEANRVGAIMSEKDVESLDAFKDSSDALGNSIRGITGHIVAQFTPALSGIIEKINDFLASAKGKAIVESLANSFGLLGQALTILVSGVGAAYPLWTIGTQLEDMGKGNKISILETIGKTIQNFGGIFMRLKAGFATGGIGGLLKSLIPEGGVTGMITGLSSTIGKLLGNLLTSFASKPAQLLQIGLNIIQGLGTGLIAAIPALLPVMLQLLASLVSFITQMLPQFISMGLTIIMQLAMGIMQAIPQLVPVVLQIATSILQFLVTNLPTLITAGVQMLVAIITGIAQALPTLIPAIAGIIPVVIQTLLDNLPLLIGAALQLIVALAQGLMAALPVLLPQIPVIIQSIVVMIIKSLPLILAAAGQIVLALVQGLLKAIPMLINMVSKGELNPTKIFIDEIKKAGPQLLQAGKDIIAGLWKGIQDAWAQFLRDMSGIIKGLPLWVQKILGIASPSKVFANIGRNMGLGLGVGFVDAMREVQQQIGRAVGGLGMQTNINLNGGMAPAYAYGHRVERPIQIILQGMPEDEMKMRRQARYIVEEIYRKGS